MIFCVKEEWKNSGKYSCQIRVFKQLKYSFNLTTHANFPVFFKHSSLVTFNTYFCKTKNELCSPKYCDKKIEKKNASRQKFTIKNFLNYNKKNNKKIASVYCPYLSYSLILFPS